MKEEFTISIFAEHSIGLLNQLTIILTRRQINIESLTTSESAIPGVHKITLVVNTTRELVEKAASQMERLIDVMMVYFHTEDEIIHQEIALYKVKTSEIMESNKIESIVRSSTARFLEITPTYVVIEKTGHKNETQELLEKLKPYGVLQFVRSGRVAITKQVKEKLTTYLQELEEANGQEKMN